VEINFGVITVSDRCSRGERLDASGPSIIEVIRANNWSVVETVIIPDDLEKIKGTLQAMAGSGQVNVILTTGGTGFAPRDVTPEATLEVAERLVPGIPEAMRAGSLKITPHAMLSRMQAGILKRT
jgi:molybdopterin adenylyltransferase